MNMRLIAIGLTATLALAGCASTSPGYSSGYGGGYNTAPANRYCADCGIVERIDVKWLKEPRQHELTITFKLPIVGDRIEWKNPKQKSQGYTLVEGEKTDVVTLSKRDGRG